MAFKVLVVILLLLLPYYIGKVSSYDLSGIHVKGNRFFNNGGQEVVLKVYAASYNKSSMHAGFKV